MMVVRLREVLRSDGTSALELDDPDQCAGDTCTGCAWCDELFGYLEEFEPAQEYLGIIPAEIWDEETREP